MVWIVAFVLQIAVITAGIRNSRSENPWSLRLFLFLLGFAAFECAILIAPPYAIHDVHNRYFWPVYFGCWLIALANLVWMIRTVRRWSSQTRS